jgi:hypothetical protein
VPLIAGCWLVAGTGQLAAAVGLMADGVLSPILRPMTAQRFATENFRRDGDRPGADLASLQGADQP